MESPNKPFLRILLLLLSLLVISGCSGAKPLPSVSVAELRAHPGTYDGQVIRVQGVNYRGSEVSTLRPLELKISIREETTADDIWLGFDSDAIEQNSSRKGERMNAAISKAEKTKAQLFFFEFEAEGVFRHVKQAAAAGSKLPAGFGHLNGYSSEFRITRLLSSKYLGGIRIELLPMERKPLVRQEYLFTDLSHSQTVVLRKKPDQEKPASLELIMEGEISGAAEIQMLLGGEPFKKEHLSGKFKITFHEDWYDPQIEVRYLTSEENSGTLKIEYTFSPRSIRALKNGSGCNCFNPGALKNGSGCNCFNPALTFFRNVVNEPSGTRG